MRWSLPALLVSIGCAHAAAPVPPKTSARPALSTAAPPASSSVTPEPFVSERIPLVPKETATPGTHAVGWTAVDLAVPQSVNTKLDAKWGEPWREFIPTVALPKEWDAWAKAEADALAKDIRPAIEQLAIDNRLALRRADWLAAAGGAEPSTTGEEAFVVLYDACQSTLAQLAAFAQKRRIAFASHDPPGWLAYRGPAVEALAKRIVEGTSVSASSVTDAAGGAVDRALASFRTAALDRATKAALEEGHARIMSFTKKPKKS